MKAWRIQMGITLVSFLLGLGLGCALLLLCVELLVASRISTLWQVAAADLDRSGGRALDILASELQAAGFRGSVDIAVPVTSGPGCGKADGWALALSPPLAFADRSATDEPVLSDGSSPDCLPLSYLQSQSDLIALRRAATLPSMEPVRPWTRRVRETQWYLLSTGDGAGAFFYRGDGVGGEELPAGSVVREWRPSIFYVRDYSVSPGDGLPSLCVERLLGSAMRSQCLVEGVVRLHLEFTLDRDGDGRGEVVTGAPTGAELAKTTQATIYLHVRSVDALQPAAKARELSLGLERILIAAGDPYLHRVFAQTVSLENLR